MCSRIPFTREGDARNQCAGFVETSALVPNAPPSRIRSPRSANRRKRASAPQLAIAWVLAKGKSIVPLVGPRTRKQLGESLGALEVKLSPSDVAQIQEALPPSAVAGTRYDEHQMKILDNER